MALVKAFKALRPHPEYADQVAAPPYDVLSADEARVLTADQPYSFLHVDKAEIDLPSDVSPYDQRVYAKARENLDKLATDGILIREDKPSLYIYRLTVDGRSQTGLAACVSVDEYERSIIKKHELTRKDKEQDRVEHVTVCGAHTGPIFLAYQSHGTHQSKEEPDTLMSGWTETHEPVYDFTADDGVRHTMWVINEDSGINAMIRAFESVPFLYVADGHHRSAAAVRVAHGEDHGNEERNYFLSVIFPHDELVILDYNRVVRDLNGYTPETFLSALEEIFTVEKCGEPVKPEQKQVFGTYIAGAWYRMTLKTSMPDDAVDGLAVSVLQNRVLSPLLGISDPQVDKRIDFVGGSRGTGELARRVDSGEMAVAFTLCPTSLAELMAVADEGRIMPPKSTWFEPKLRSGLLIHTF